MAREPGRREQPPPSGPNQSYRASVRQVLTLNRILAKKLTPADPGDLAAVLASALLFDGRKRLHPADEVIARIVARRQVEHLERAGFVVMKRPTTGGRRQGPKP
jgi:hypothetical protein